MRSACGGLRVWERKRAAGRGGVREGVSIGLMALVCFGAMACSGRDEVPRGADAGPADMASADPKAPQDAGRDASRDVQEMDEGSDGGSVDAGPDLPEGVGLRDRPLNTSCLAGERPSAEVEVELERVFADVSMSQPVGLYQAPDEEGFWYVVQRDGVVFRFHEDERARERLEVLDYRQEVNASLGGELGLLGLAFHPQFASNRRAFISYTYGSSPVRSRVSEITALDGGQFDPLSERVVMEIEQPYRNHNGGMIAFGPDRLLYIAMGDGGSARDPLNHGQNTLTPLGAILRVDVDNEEPYTIPQDNPFAQDTSRGLPELYAWGLRNPWKMSFDLKSGELWAGDVGQGAQEEVNLIELGGNYGWKVREGELCHGDHPECETRLDLIAPRAVYGRDEGKSITGGYVYHGAAIPSLQGRYLYGDFVSGTIWSLGYDAVTGEARDEVLLPSTGLAISSFAQDRASGEVFVIDMAPGAGEPGVYRIAPQQNAPESPGRLDLPALLSETGCVDPREHKEPAAGLIPYAPKAPFWSDGATKQRFIALPDGEVIERDVASGALKFPPGTVLVKHFDRDGKRVETRLFARHEDGVWAGYTYAWRADQSDAELLKAGELRGDAAGTGEPWRYPSRAQCLSCHNAAAGHVLGFDLLQLAERPLDYTEGRGDQLRTLDHLGLFSPPLLDPIEEMPALVDPFDESADLSKRARAYLHTNCASCHLPEGPARGELDLRALVPLAQTGGCDEAPLLDTLGLDEARLIAPGEAARSVLWQRMVRDDVRRMPSEAGLLIDKEGAALIAAWIEALEWCDR